MLRCSSFGPSSGGFALIRFFHQWSNFPLERPEEIEYVLGSIRYESDFEFDNALGMTQVHGSHVGAGKTNDASCRAVPHVLFVPWTMLDLDHTARRPAYCR